MPAVPRWAADRSAPRSGSFSNSGIGGKRPKTIISGGTSGRSKPTTQAPDAIRNGGTLITISKLDRSRPRPNMELTVKRLAHRYRPALLKGKKYKIIDARKGEAKEYELS